MRCFAYGCGPRAQEPCEPCQAGNRAALSGGLLVLRSVRIRMQSSAAAGHTPRGPCPFFYAAKYFTGGGCIVPCAVPQVASAQVCGCCWPGSIVTALQNQIAAGRIGHAYLFTGTRGTGKTTCAKIFAKAVNCLDTTSRTPAVNVLSAKALMRHHSGCIGN